MFCAIATAIDRCKTEGLVDVFQVVKVQRIQKPGLVQDVVSAILIACIETEKKLNKYLRLICNLQRLLDGQSNFLYLATL